MGKLSCDAMEAEVVRAMGAMGALPALIFLGAFFVLAHVDTEVVVLSEGFGADGALKRAWSIEEVDVLMEADIIFLGGAVIALQAFVRLFSSMGSHVNTDFGLISEQFRTYEAAGGFWTFGRHV